MCNLRAPHRARRPKAPYLSLGMGLNLTNLIGFSRERRRLLPHRAYSSHIIHFVIDIDNDSNYKPLK